MSGTNQFVRDVLRHYFNNIDHANIGDAAGLQNSAADGNFYVSLHTTPGPAESDTAQTANETAYGGYARVAVSRTSGWTVAAAADPGNASNTGVISFPVCTSGSSTITHFGIGSDSAGAGNLFLFGALTSSLAVSTGITPSFAAGALDVNLD